MNTTKLHILKNTIILLENSILEFEKKVGKPSFISDGTGRYYPRFLEPNSQHFQFLMAVKIVSTLNGILCLLKENYIQEAAALVRIVDECSAKICCIQEAHINQSLNAEQSNIIDGYFEYDLKSVDDLKNKEKWWCNMDRVFASHARFLSKGTSNKDVAGIQDGCRTLYDAFTGYIHGFYSHIMELYNHHQESYNMKGVSDPFYLNPMYWTVASVVLRSLNVFAIIAAQLGLEDLRKRLIENRDIFINSEAYKSKE
jgi:hypothetical protein